MATSLEDLIKISKNLSPKKRELIAKLVGADINAGQSEPIAVVGMSCRFPGGANSPEEFWDLLDNKRDGISEIPDSRWPVDEYYDPDIDKPGKMWTRWAGLVDNVDKFDPGFFGLSKTEADSMDPQQRLLLEVTYEALEEAAYTRESLSKSPTGVFVGMHSQSSDYFHLQAGDVKNYNAYTMTGVTHCIMANRISYLLDLWGPSFAVDTACSSSLVAIHLACDSLRKKESNLAVASGVNLLLSPLTFVTLSKLNTQSPDGRCRTFDSRANGYVRSEGAGAVVLKRLSDAKSRGDNILAVIHGSAVNQDGKTNGMTAPNSISQMAVLREAVKNARLSPSDIDYVETHGTGTPLGDPIEVEAIREVYGDVRSDDSKCVLGAVKSNIGHLEGAAGVAGVIKIILSLQNSKIPSNIHFEKLNEGLKDYFEDSSLIRADEPVAWNRNSNRKRIAGVSSFGFGGTNSHIIIGEAPAIDEIQSDAQRDDDNVSLLKISAHTPDALKELAGSYIKYLKQNTEDVTNISYTAGKYRENMQFRLAIAGKTTTDLIASLEAFQKGEANDFLANGRAKLSGNKKIAFVFSGVGTQWIGMGRQLIEEVPVFRDKIKEIDAIFKEYSGWSIMEELKADAEASRLGNTDVSLPASFAIQLALTAYWESLGIKPAGVVGHSSGEVAAAYVSGALTFKEAIKVIYHRSKFMHAATGLGKMAAVDAKAEVVEPFLSEFSDKVVIGAYNAPGTVLLSGEEEALTKIIAKIKDKNIRAKILDANYPSHSPLMQSIADELVKTFNDFDISPFSTGDSNQVQVYSTVTGKLAAKNDYSADYWGRNVRGAVKFQQAIESMADDDYNVFLEIGPNPALVTYVSAILETKGKGDDEYGIAYTMRREKDEVLSLKTSLGKLFTFGLEIDDTFEGKGKIVRLPRVPWQYKRFWLEHIGVQGGAGSGQNVSPGRKQHDKLQDTDGISDNELGILERLEAAEVSEKENIFTQYVKELFAKALGFEASHAIDFERSFFDIGGDSLSAVALKNQLQNDINCQLPVTLAFEHPSVKALSSHIYNDVLSLNPVSEENSRGENKLNTENISANLEDELIAKELENAIFSL